MKNVSIADDDTKICNISSMFSGKQSLNEKKQQCQFCDGEEVC